MSDNYTTNAGTGGDTFGADDIAGVKIPRVKLIIGADGVNDGDVASANPLPVTGTVAVTNAGLTELAAAINASSQIDVNIAASAATLTVASHAVTNAGTFAVQVSSALPAGTNAIGKLAANSGVDIGDVDILSIAAGDNNIGNVDLASAIPAGTNLIGRISASPETSTVYNGTTALTPKFAVVDNATSGDNTLVAAVTGKKIRVHQLALIGSAAVTVRFESGASGTALTGQMQFAANGGFVLPFSPMGWFETASDTLLNMELNGATSVDGVLGYTEV